MRCEYSMGNNYMDMLYVPIHQNTDNDAQSDQSISITNDYFKNTQIILLGDVYSQGRWCRNISYVVPPYTIQPGKTITYTFPAPRRSIVRTAYVISENLNCRQSIPAKGTSTFTVTQFQKCLGEEQLRCVNLGPGLSLCITWNIAELEGHGSFIVNNKEVGKIDVKGQTDFSYTTPEFAGMKAVIDFKWRGTCLYISGHACIDLPIIGESCFDIVNKSMCF